MNIQTKYRRLLAVLAAWALLAVLAVPARAEDAEIQATVTISTGVQGGQAEVAAPWDDGWFTEEAGTYRHELALVSMALSGAAYLGGKDTGIQAALEAIPAEPETHFRTYHGELIAFVPFAVLPPCHITFEIKRPAAAYPAFQFQ